MKKNPKDNLMANYKYNNNASEQLGNGGYDFPIKDDYHLIIVGATTVQQLKSAGIIPSKNYGELINNKPDALILKGKNKVVALIESKRKGKFNSTQDAYNAISNWYFDLAKKLSCKTICATDNALTIWVNTNTKSSYIEGGQDFDYVLDISECTDANKAYMLYEPLQKLIDAGDNGIIANTKKVLNPQSLADKVWQKIWITTGKSPEACLYNVVEIFIFKYLSDLGVLTNTKSFEKVCEVIDEEGNKAALEYYANNIRKYIRNELFPQGADGTSILNGTIFVNENEEANTQHAGLFCSVIKDYKEYCEREGSLKFIDKTFKTRLYETFLRKEASISTMGQYFTPRNVVKGMLDMVPSIPDNSVICDPFCGVGGFLLEIINNYDNIKEQFNPKYGKIKTSCIIKGYDKGTDEKDDARTIILAKANMLIYLSDYLSQHTELTKEFAEVFNNTFSLIKTNLGTFGISEDDKYDFIFTNPPYVVKGVKTIKEEIAGNKHVAGKYPSNGIGLEGLAIDWIINALKPNGRAFIVVPTGVLQRQSDRKLRDRLRKDCYIDGIISLPPKTFYSTPQKTYILAITKKQKEAKLQTEGVFAYVVSEIGETKDSNRHAIESNDLVDMAREFKYYCADKKNYNNNSARIRIIPFDSLVDNWVVDEYWTNKELQELGLRNEALILSVNEYKDKIKDLEESLADIVKNWNEEDISVEPCRKIKLSEIFIWKKGSAKYTQNYMLEHPGDYKVYTANTKGDGTSGKKIDTYDFEGECIRLTTNGEYAGSFSYISEGKYSLNGDAGRIVVKEEYHDSIHLPYIYAVLQTIREENRLLWTKKPTKEFVENLEITIPVKEDEITFDIEKQKIIAEKYQALIDLRGNIRNSYEEINASIINILK